MHIALAYDLRQHYLDAGFTEEETAEFDSKETIYALAGTLVHLGYRVEQVGNVFDLTRALANGRRWDLVFNICEGLMGRSREAQVPALLEAYGIPCTFSDPLTMAVSLDKAVAKAVVRAAGVPTPEFHLISGPGDIEGCPLAEYPLFIKPVAEGTGKGVDERSVINSREELRRGCLALLERYGQPVLVETFLPGREFTVGILGTGEDARVIGVLEIELHDDAERLVYSFANKEHCERLVTYRLVADPEIVRMAGALALAAHRALQCRDTGRVDLRADARGNLQFIEMNPLPGLHPTHSDLPILATEAGMTYGDLIKAIVTSAMKRAFHEKRPRNLAALMKKAVG